MTRGVVARRRGAEGFGCAMDAKGYSPPPFLAGVEGKMRARNRIFDARGFKAILVGGIEEDRLRYDVAQRGQQFALDNAPIVKRKCCNSN